MAQFFGAPPMALLTVAGGCVLIGDRVLGADLAITLGWGLWISGTIMGLFAAVAIPYLLFTRYKVRDDAAFGGWLMPVVPPMVSAAIGALFIPHAGSLQMQATLLYGCIAMFGMSLIPRISFHVRPINLHAVWFHAILPTLFYLFSHIYFSI